MGIEKIKSGISDVVESIDSGVQDSISFMKDMKEASWEKVSSSINEILGLAPLIEATGFNMKDLSVDATIPPGIVFSFIKEKEVSSEDIDKLLNENKNKDILNLIVRALQKADSIQKSMNLSHYKFNGLTMKFGFPPDISLKFSRIPFPPSSG